MAEVEGDSLNTIEFAEDKHSDWASLPNELLHLILSHLWLDDINAFHNICRAWQSIPTPLTYSPIKCPVVRSQWLMCIGQDGKRCKFFHPVYNEPYCLDIPELFGSVIRFSKDGWLLMSTGKYSVFFYNPFTKARIDLPDLPRIYDLRCITFSSSPTSSNCLVFGIFGFFEQCVSIYTLRRGEESWRVQDFDNNLPIIPSPSNPVLYNRKFFCLGQDGNLGSFDPEECEWKVHDNPRQPSDPAFQNFLTECDGNLLSVFVGSIGKWVSVFKLNTLKMTWEKVDDLEDNALFVSNSTSLSSKKVVDGMENKIYFPRFNGKCEVFFSLASGVFGTFGNDFSQKDFCKTREYLHCCWIEPNISTYSEEELNWLAYPWA